MPFKFEGEVKIFWEDQKLRECVTANSDTGWNKRIIGISLKSYEKKPRPHKGKFNNGALQKLVFFDNGI